VLWCVNNVCVYVCTYEKKKNNNISIVVCGVCVCGDGRSRACVRVCVCVCVYSYCWRLKGLFGSSESNSKTRIVGAVYTHTTHILLY